MLYYDANISVSNTATNTLYLNVNEGVASTADAGLGTDELRFVVSSTSGLNGTIKPVVTASGMSGSLISGVTSSVPVNTFSATKYAAGEEIINPDLPSAELANFIVNSWPAGAGPGYLGFSFKPDTTTLYGWAQFDLTEDLMDPGVANDSIFALKLLDFAYDDSGATLNAGVIPEPSTAGIGWEGADWHTAGLLLEAGVMPVLAGLIRRGISGNLLGFQPHLPPLSWTTLATGKWPVHHGIHGLHEVAHERIRPTSSSSRGVSAFWNLLSPNGIPIQLIGWPATHPPEAIHGVNVTSEFLQQKVDDSLEPKAIADDLIDLRVNPGDLDSGLLGLLISGIKDFDPTRDPRPAQLMGMLAGLYSTHNHAIHFSGKEGCLAVYYDFLRHAAINQEITSNAYRLQDLLLGDLIRNAGPDTTVMLVSTTSNGTSAGIFATAGAGIVTGGKKSRAVRLEDIAPTLLNFYQIASSAEMDGRVLEEIFTHPSPSVGLKRLPVTVFSPAATGASTPVAAAEILRQNSWNVGMAMMSIGRAKEALPWLERCYFEEPESAAYAGQTALCRLELNLLPEARQAMATIEDFGPDQALPRIINARLLLAAHQPEKAWQALGETADFTGPFEQDFIRLKCQVLFGLRRYSEAETEISAAMKRWPAQPGDFIGLGQVQLAAGNFIAAAATAQAAIDAGGAKLASISLQARALDRGGRFVEARAAYQGWLDEEPAAVIPRRRLQALAKNPPLPLPASIDPALRRQQIPIARRTSNGSSKTSETLSKHHHENQITCFHHSCFLRNRPRRSRCYRRLGQGHRPSSESHRRIHGSQI